MDETDETRMEEAVTALKAVQEFDAERLARPELHDFSFGEIVPYGQRIVTFYRQIPLSGLRWLPIENVVRLRDDALASKALLDDVISWQPLNDGNPAQARRNKIATVKASFGQLWGSNHWLVSYLAAAERDRSAELRNAVEEISREAETAKKHREGAEASLQDLQRIIESGRQVASEAAASKMSTHFSDAASDHSTASKIWLACTAIISIFFILLSAIAIYLHDNPAISPDTVQQSIQVALGKILVFGTLGFGIVLSARNYGAHKHNMVINAHRANALETFRALVEATKDPDKRDIVLTHAAACIFGPQETGFTKHPTLPEGPATKLIEVFPSFGGKP